jgi:hypothetical protein
MARISRRTVVGGALAAAVAVPGANAVLDYSAEEYDAILRTSTEKLPSSPDALDFIRYATLAANGHNTQPWLFRAAAGAIEILPDFSRATPVVDPDNHHLYASLGCAAENLVIAARARGRSGDLSFSGGQPDMIRIGMSNDTPEASLLLDAIPKRRSTRAPFDGSPAPASVLARLEAASRIGGVELHVITAGTMAESVLELLIAGNSRQMDDPAFMAELKLWLRFNPRAAARTRDGLFSASSGNPVLPGWLGSIMFDLAFSKKAENKKYAEQVRTSSGLAVFVAPTDDPAGWVAAGRSCQRFSLLATVDGLKTSFINQCTEDKVARRELQSILGIGNLRPNLVMRFGYGPDLPRSLRRAPQSVLVA